MINCSRLFNSLPDAAAVFSENDSHTFKTSPYKWNDVEITQSPSGAINVTAEQTPLCFIRLRWNFKIPEGTLFQGDAWERSYGDLQWSGFAPSKLMPWYFLMQTPERCYGIGVKVRAGAFAGWTADPAGISLFLDLRCGGKGVLLNGRTLKAVELVGKSYPQYRAFPAAHDFCTLLCTAPRLPEFPVYGSNNWYYAYGRITEKSVLEDCRLLAELTQGIENRPFMVIDAGWEQSRSEFGDGSGPWNCGNRNFPDMQGLAEKIKTFDVRPGIWYRPLLRRDSRLSSVCFLRKEVHVLDPSVPEVLDIVRQDVTRFRNWGFELLKHDFTTYDITGHYAFNMQPWPCNGDWSFFERSKTSAEIICNLYRTIREAAGPVLISGCNVVGHLAAGLQELSRTGDDTSGFRWERVRHMGVNTIAFRYAQHKTFFDMDADCVGISGKIPWNLNREWAKLAAESGSCFFISLKPDALTDEIRRELRALLEIASKGNGKAEPIDWQQTTTPERWIINGKAVEFQWFEPDGDVPDFIPIDWNKVCN